MDKETIEEVLYNLIEFGKNDSHVEVLVENIHFRAIFHLWTLYNMQEKQIETQQDELEDLQNQIAELKDKLDEKNYTIEKQSKDISSHLLELQNKDKAINKMAEDLTTPIHDKEWIINYYLKEIEEC